MLSKEVSSTIFKSLVWLGLGLNPGLPDHWRTLYPLGQWVGIKLFFMVCDIYIYIYIYKTHYIRFQTFFVWVLLLIVHTWNSSPLPSNLLRQQFTCCTVPTTSGRPHGSSLVWACQWPSSQTLSFPQLSHNDRL